MFRRVVDGRHAAVRGTAPPLLDDMRQLVREQSGRRLLSCPEDDVVTDRECGRVQGVRGGGMGVDAHRGEVLVKARLEEAALDERQRPTGRLQDARNSERKRRPGSRRFLPLARAASGANLVARTRLSGPAVLAA